MAIHYHYSKEHTGLNDINGLSITEDSWIKADDDHYKQSVYHYVFWDESFLTWNTVKFCHGNEKLDMHEELWRLRKRNPLVCEKPDWITQERLDNKLKYRTNIK